MGDFGVQKTLDTLKEHFYWPNMKKDAEILRALYCLQKGQVKGNASWFVYPFTNSGFSMD